MTSWQTSLLRIGFLGCIAIVGLVFASRPASAAPNRFQRWAAASSCSAPTVLTTADQYPNPSTYLATQVANLPENACAQLPNQTIDLAAPIRPKTGQTILGQGNTTLIPLNARLDAFQLEGVKDVRIEGVKILGRRQIEPGIPAHNYGADRGYGTGIRMVNVERVQVVGTTIDDMFTGIDCRLGCKDLLIERNTLIVRSGNVAGDSDWNCGNSGFLPTDRSVCTFEYPGKVAAETVPGAKPLLLQTIAAFCPYDAKTSRYLDCPERIGDVATDQVLNPKTVSQATEFPLLPRRSSPNPSNGSPFFGVKGALINVDGEMEVVKPGQPAPTTVNAERITITGNTLRGSDRTCDASISREPQRWPVPPSDRDHAKRGMLLTAIRDLTVTQNDLSCLYFSGIALASVKNGAVTDNRLRYLERAIYLFHSTETVQILRNTIEDSVGGAGTSAAAIEIARYAKAIAVNDNTLNRILGFGIRATTPTIATNTEERLTTSTIMRNSITMAIEHRAANIPITLHNPSMVTVYGNQLVNGLYGVEIREDWGQRLLPSVYSFNRFRAFEIAAFHKLEATGIAIAPKYKPSRIMNNTKEDVRIFLSRNSNEFLLQRITNPTTYAQPFAMLDVGGL